MVGQQHVLQALTNALDEERLHHAYLFTGTRGVGKTTIARILVKCLNCETGITSTPCGECSSCKEITEGRFLDLIEVDAASRTKVEDTRELLENIHYAPTRGRFKVYLIDEVHMLSGHSFNALLKTLEEPPPHVKFLFATTDPQKLPVTILSRCLQFNLKRMPIDLITKHLKTILDSEKTSFDEPSLRLLARGADGSMRDALSLMDQAIGYGAGKLEEAEVREMLGTISHDWLFTLVNAANEGNGKKLIKTIEDMAGQVPDFEAAADGLISLLHQVAIQQAVPEIEQSDDYINQLANKLTIEDVQLYYQIAIQARKDLPLSPDPRAGFEMLLLRMMTFRPLGINESLPAPATSEPDNHSETKKKLSDFPSNTTKDDNIQVANGDQSEYIASTTESPSSNSSIPYTPELSGSEMLTPQPAESIEEMTTPPTSDEPNNKSGERDWHTIVTKLKLTGMVAQLANHCLLDKHQHGTIYLLLDQEGKELQSKNAEAGLQAALETFFNEPTKVVITTTQITTETPDKRRVREAHERQQAAEQQIINDPLVQEIQTELDATIVTGSIKIKE
jgi:DNA polymerase-3 subunit gamma/tau